jgi:LPXTG-site transpeptidase (sortase) family protein
MKEPFFVILEKLGNIHSLQNPFFPEEYIQKHFVFAIGGIQEMSRKNPKSPSEADKLPARKRRPGSIMLNILIVILLVSGLYLIFEPIVGRWRQDNCSQQLLQNFDEGDGTIVIGYDEFIVAGEEYDYYDDLETSSSSSTDSITTTASQTQTTESVTVTTTSATTTPKKIVIQAIGRIIIPSISVKMPIAEGANLHNLRVAIGHYTNSPSAGEPGVAIYLGHRSYTYGRHFNRMDEVKIGETIIIETKTTRYTYEVDQIDVVEPDDLLYEFNNPTSEPRIMLVTCTPVRIATHRLLVKGKLVKTDSIG